MMIKEFRLLSCGLVILFLVMTNPSPQDLKKNILNKNLVGKENIERILNLTNGLSRQNYGVLSIYQIPPSLIYEMEVNPQIFNYEINNIQVVLVGVGGIFVPTSDVDTGLKFIGGYLELCRTAAIDCRKFLFKYPSIFLS